MLPTRLCVCAHMSVQVLKLPLECFVNFGFFYEFVINLSFSLLFLILSFSLHVMFLHLYFPCSPVKLVYTWFQLILCGVVKLFVILTLHNSSACFSLI